MKNLYLFSGLGADHRAFVHLQLTDVEITHIRWIPPIGDEPIEKYARRLTEQISASNPVLIGLSFGGMVAVEVAKLIQTERVILLASAKTRNEIPAYLRIAGALRFHTLLPARLLTWPNSFVYWLFGVKTILNKSLLDDILCDTDPAFLKWAINAVAMWTNIESPQNVFHIHGTEDHILPICAVKNALPIVGGGHLMTLDYAPAISLLIQEALDL